MLMKESSIGRKEAGQLRKRDKSQRTIWTRSQKNLKQMAEAMGGARAWQSWERGVAARLA